NCGVHIDIQQVRLLVCDNDVDVVGAAQAVGRDRQQAVRVGRQVDARDTRALIGNDIQEPWILVCETVVILPPNGGGNQQVERGDIGAPRQLARLLQPF